MSDLTLPCYFCNEVFYDRDLYLFDYSKDTSVEIPVCRRCLRKLNKGRFERKKKQ